jgi:hypothetical protein
VENLVEMRRLLAETAFLACIRNDAPRARRIAEGLAAIAPDSLEAAVAFAFADMTGGDIEGALRRLRPLADAGDAHAMAFLALALKLGGRAAERDAVLNRIPTGDPVIDQLAAALR